MKAVRSVLTLGAFLARAAADTWRGLKGRSTELDWCAYCLRPLQKGLWNREHVVPRSAGGTDGPENIIRVHASCNARRGATPLLVWMAALERADYDTRQAAALAAYWVAAPGLHRLTLDERGGPPPPRGTAAEAQGRAARLRAAGCWRRGVVHAGRVPGGAAGAVRREEDGMSHGDRAEKVGHAGREYWSRRPGVVMGTWGRISKWLTHRAERAERRRDERRRLADARYGRDTDE